MQTLIIDRPFDPQAIYGQSQQPIVVNVRQGMIEGNGTTQSFIRRANMAIGTAMPIQVHLPGMPKPTQISPHPSTIPVVVKLNMGYWRSDNGGVHCV